MNRLTVSQTLLFILAVASFAQFKPAVPKEIQALAPFAGTWKGVIGSEATPQTSGPATITISPILDGVYVQLDLLHELPGPIIVRGQTTFAWNPKTSKIQSFTFGNGGMEDPSRPREESGTIKDGVLKMEGKMGGAAYYQSYRLLPDGKLKYEFGFEANGKFAVVGGGTLTKSK